MNSTMISRTALRGALVIALTSAFALSVARQSIAGFYTLVDENSVAQFDTTTQANAYNWIVDGQNQLYQQAFWYRIGNAGPEHSLDTLAHPTEVATDTNGDGLLDNLFVQYNGAGFRVKVTYSLQGGLLGSNSSDMGEQIAITNLGTSALDYHFFQYSDFDLQNNPNGDTAVFTQPNTVQQTKGPARLSETVVTPTPAHREIDFYANTLNRLNDGVATTLDDLPPVGNPLGPGDATWAFQWDVTLAPGKTFQISKDKNLSGVGVPEPAALISVLIGVGLLGVRRRNREIAS